MNIDDFRYITTIADLGSFNAAANKLFIAQPSLSQRVKYIEKTYGITIFIRDTKGSSLTAEGDRFVHYARIILNAEEDLRNEIQDIHIHGNTVLRVGIPQFIYSSFFNEMLSYFHEKDTNLQLEIIEGPSLHLQQCVLSNELDLAICYLPIESSGLSYDIIYEDEFVLVPAKGGTLEQKIQAASANPGSQIDPRLLDNEAFAVGMQGTRSHKFLMSVLEKHNIDVKIVYQCKNFPALYRITQRGIASAFLNESLFDETQESKPYYYLQNTNTSLSVAMVWRKGSYLKNIAKRLIRYTREIEQKRTTEETLLTVNSED
jgi:LysR family hydrogen peroxide-inducible transcriptional activator